MSISDFCWFSFIGLASVVLIVLGVENMSKDIRQLREEVRDIRSLLENGKPLKKPLGE